MLGNAIANALGEPKPRRQLELPTAEQTRDAAIDRVAESHAAFVAKVVAFIRDLGPISFTTDDLWKAFAHPPEPRAMGAAIRQARRDGLIVGTGEYVKSMRRECHARPIPVWRRA